MLGWFTLNGTHSGSGSGGSRTFRFALLLLALAILHARNLADRGGADGVRTLLPSVAGFAAGNRKTILCPGVDLSLLQN